MVIVPREELPSSDRSRVPIAFTGLSLQAACPVVLPGLPAQEARAANGRIWRRAWALPDRLVIDFVDLAVAEVLDDGTVTVDRDLPSDLAEHLLLDHLLPLALARRGELVLHGAVLSHGDRSAVVIGPSGAGKSTLSAHAWQRGWSLGGDDAAVLSLGGDGIQAGPTHPTVRLTSASVTLLGMSSHGEAPAVGKRRLLTADCRRAKPEESVEVAVITIIEPVSAGGTARLVPLTGVDAHLALFGCTFYADLARGHALRSIVERLAQVAERTTIARLTVPRGSAGLAAAERLLRRQVLA